VKQSHPEWRVFRGATGNEPKDEILGTNGPI